MLSHAFLAPWFDGNEPPAEQVAQFLDAFRAREIPTRTTVFRAGNTPREFGVVASGLLRLFYLRDDGRELNKSFLSAGDFVGAVDALLSGRPTRMWLETIEPSVIWFAEYQVLTELYACHAGWERLGRRFAEMLYLKKIAREAAFLMDSAAERYRAFLDDYPEIENRIPDYHIASYLGISAESLSRLKNARTRGGRNVARRRE